MSECAPIPANLDYEIAESALPNEMILVDNASGTETRPLKK